MIESMGLGRRLRRAWATLPWWARWVLAIYLIGFADGTAAHARDPARAGFGAYSGFPQVPLREFFISLVFLDPLVVVLAALVLRATRIVRDSAPHSGAYPAR